MVTRAKVYQHRPDRWHVQLYWMGTRYRRFWFDPVKRIPMVHPTLAEKVAEQINDDIATKGKYFDPSAWFAYQDNELLFSRYAAKWLKGAKHYAPSYYPDVARYVEKWMVPALGEIDLREIRKRHIKDLLEMLNHYAPKTQENILGILHKILTDAWHDYYPTVLGVPPFPRVSVPEPELIYLPQAEIYKGLDHIPAADQPIFRVGYFYAMRPGEARALQFDCIDFKNSHKITIKRTFSGSILRDYTKTRTIRYIPMMDEPAAILRQIRGIAGFVFRTPRFGKPYRKQRLGQLWRKASAAAGIPRIPLYNAMRHSRAMHLLEHEGWDIEYVRALLGHTRAEMTRRYARASSEGLRKRYDKTEKANEHSSIHGK